MKFLDYENLPPLDCEDPEEDEIMSGSFHHVPVLLQEVVAFLRPAPGVLIVDGTLGGGGHSEALLKAGARVIAVDRDPEALGHASSRLSTFGNRFSSKLANYCELDSVLDQMGVTEIGGALLDLGVSSHQLDTAERGFAFMQDGPLDMRMGGDRQGGMTAADLVNTMPVAELTRIFREYGEEAKAFQAAARLAVLRDKEPFTTTAQLAEAVQQIIPRSGKRHPATKIFQALRIAVNDELGSLEKGLSLLANRLARGARLAVITFHSLEDRIVKQHFRHHSVEWIDRPEWPEPRRNPDRLFRLLTPRPLDAGPEEIHTNPRARSAKLRVVEKL